MQRTDHTSYATIDVGVVSVESGALNGAGDIFSNDELCLLEFTRSGDRGDKGSQGFTGYQGFQGVQGFTGFQGVQGSTLAWWNSFKLNYDNTSYSGSGISTGEWRPGDNLTTLANEPYLFSESSNNYHKISLEGWVELGILRKTVNDPAVGRTTYKLVRDVTIDATKSASLGPWWDSVPDPYVSGVNGTLYATAPDGGMIYSGNWGNLSSDTKRQYELEYYWLVNFDITFNNHIYLQEGDVFDGNGHTILLNHDICYNEITGVYGVITGLPSLVSSKVISQHGLFRLEEFYSGGYYDNNKSIGAWSKTPITIKNLKYGGSAPTNMNGGFYWNYAMGDTQTAFIRGNNRPGIGAGNRVDSNGYTGSGQWYGVNIINENLYLLPRRSYGAITGSAWSGVLTPGYSNNTGTMARTKG